MIGMAAQKSGWGISCKIKKESSVPAKGAMPKSVLVRAAPSPRMARMNNWMLKPELRAPRSMAGRITPGLGKGLPRAKANINENSPAPKPLVPTITRGLVAEMLLWTQQEQL